MNPVFSVETAQNERALKLLYTEIGDIYAIFSKKASKLAKRASNKKRNKCVYTLFYDNCRRFFREETNKR
jgi:hypothetical protein